MNIQTIKKNRKKPSFLRQDAHKVKSLKKVWRKPKGMHNKMRWCLRGLRWHPAIGYKLNNNVRGLNQEGLKGVLVYNINNLNKIGKGEGVIIAANVGMKNKIQILEKIKSLGLKCLNLDVHKTLENINNELKNRKEKKKTKKVEKKETEEKKETKKEERPLEKSSGKTEEKKEDHKKPIEKKKVK